MLLQIVVYSKWMHSFWILLKTQNFSRLNQVVMMKCFPRKKSLNFLPISCIRYKFSLWLLVKFVIETMFKIHSNNLLYIYHGFAKKLNDCILCLVEWYEFKIELCFKNLFVDMNPQIRNNISLLVKLWPFFCC